MAGERNQFTHTLRMSLFILKNRTVNKKSIQIIQHIYHTKIIPKQIMIEIRQDNLQQ